MKNALNGKKIALIHDWMFERRGGEKVLDAILDLVPSCDLFYLFGTPKKNLKHHYKIEKYFPSFLNSLPFIKSYYKALLPLFPLAVESFDLSGYDIVISTSSCVAKGVIPHPYAIHITYIHSPMRYAWDMETVYFPKRNFIRSLLLSRLRLWDMASSVRSHTMIANSQYVANRCLLYYGRKADVIHPPLELERFLPSPTENSSLDTSKTSKILSQKTKILLFGAWVPYKKMKQGLTWLLEAGYEVVAAGHGAELETSKHLFSREAKLGQVSFHISPKDEAIVSLYQNAKIVVFPCIEDFGIVAAEALASGTFVIAPRVGGTKEILQENVTGFTFIPDNKIDFLEAVKRAFKAPLTPDILASMKKTAESLSTEHFKTKFFSALEKTMKDHICP